MNHHARQYQHSDISIYAHRRLMIITRILGRIHITLLQTASLRTRICTVSSDSEVQPGKLNIEGVLIGPCYHKKNIISYCQFQRFELFTSGYLKLFILAVVDKCFTRAVT